MTFTKLWHPWSLRSLDDMHRLSAFATQVFGRTRDDTPQEAPSSESCFTDTTSNTQETKSASTDELPAVPIDLIFPDGTQATVTDRCTQQRADEDVADLSDSDEAETVSSNRQSNRQSSKGTRAKAQETRFRKSLPPTFWVKKN